MMQARWMRRRNENGEIEKFYPITHKDAVVGLENLDNTADIDKPISNATQDALDKKVENTTTINGMALTQNITLNAEDVGAEEAGAVNIHNESENAHNDIRELISKLSEQVNNFLDVDDTTKDQLSEVLALIQDNADIIEAITTGKVNVSDIVNDLETNDSSKVLSAAQGAALKALIDALQESLNTVSWNDLQDRPFGELAQYTVEVEELTINCDTADGNGYYATIENEYEQVDLLLNSDPDSKAFLFDGTMYDVKTNVASYGNQQYI